MRVELLWFEGCPNHEVAEALLRDVLREGGAPAPVTKIQVEDEATGDRVGFPGSPTIRIDGVDVEPGFVDCEDCTPRCRVYQTEAGFRGLPERAWIEAAVARAITREAVGGRE